jgi:hypothetical protein
MKSNKNFVKGMGVVLKLMHHSILTMSEKTLRSTFYVNSIF